MPNTAVVVVHGVADQKPGESGEAIVRLLSNLDVEPGHPAYEPFVGHDLSVPVRPLPVPGGLDLEKTTFGKRAGSLRTLLRATNEPVDVNIEFMSTLIAGYQPSGPDETYQTAVHSSTRQAIPRAGTQAEAAHVHVYEMYWADLSRLTQNWLNIFVELYQLIFHLGSLGVHAVNAAQVSETDDASHRTWQRWAKAQRRAANAVALGLVLPNLWMAGLLIILCLNWLPDIKSFAVGESRVVAVIALCVVSAAIYFLMRAYSRYRPSALKAFWLLSAPIAGTYVGTLFVRRGESVLQAATVCAAEIAYLLMCAAFVWLVINMWIALWSGWRVMSASGASRSKMRRVLWTAALTLILQSVVFTLVTTISWTAINLAIVKILPAFGQALHPPFLLHGWLGIREWRLAAFEFALIQMAAGVGFGVMAALTALAGVIVLVLIVPSAWYEVVPPPEGADGSRSGRRLTRAFSRMRVAGWIVFVGMVVVMPLGEIVTFVIRAKHVSWAPRLQDFSTELLVWAGRFLVVGVTSLVAFRSRLKSLLLQLHNGLDVALDVDNYLREHPRGRTPRARIVARYTSLLRHVLAQNCDRVVIVAHSQGTVITADLLRYLWWHERQSPGYLERAGLARLRDVEVVFYSMGCPLRQLYSQRFPHLYQWARFEETGDGADASNVIPDETQPLAWELGLSGWINAYRSADYVGRHLWRQDDVSGLFDSSSSRPAGHPWVTGAFNVSAAQTAAGPVEQREYCIGRGAHTHYWDRTAPQVALEIDQRIRS